MPNLITNYFIPSKTQTIENILIHPTKKIKISENPKEILDTDSELDYSPQNAGDDQRRILLPPVPPMPPIKTAKTT